jgi:crotonobetainyl-CoA:carnitine CoA-transferase CaiB-like acyl-CoA transferase
MKGLADDFLLLVLQMLLQGARPAFRVHLDARRRRRGIPSRGRLPATSDPMYAKFCRLLGLEELIDDPRFATNNDRVRHRDEIMPLFEGKMKEKTSQEWLRLFEEAGIPCGPILDIGEVFAAPHVKARDMMFAMPPPSKRKFPSWDSRTSSQKRHRR